MSTSENGTLTGQNNPIRVPMVTPGSTTDAAGTRVDSVTPDFQGADFNGSNPLISDSDRIDGVGINDVGKAGYGPSILGTGAGGLRSGSVLSSPAVHLVGSTGSRAFTSKEDEIKERLAKYSPEQIHDFIRRNRDIAKDLEEMVIKLLKEADMVADEILQRLITAKAQCCQVIEYALEVLYERTDSVDRDREPRPVMKAPKNSRLLKQLQKI